MSTLLTEEERNKNMDIAKELQMGINLEAPSSHDMDRILGIVSERMNKITNFYVDASSNLAITKTMVKAAEYGLERVSKGECIKEDIMAAKSKDIREALIYSRSNSQRNALLVAETEKIYAETYYNNIKYIYENIKTAFDAIKTRSKLLSGEMYLAGRSS